MRNIIITGCGTDVGKTIVSAIFTDVLQADYWKPIECGPESDSNTIKTLIELKENRMHPSVYSLKAPLSPHHAARLENIDIDVNKIRFPTTRNRLVIETAGGILVPLTMEKLTEDIFQTWDAVWVVVSRHYLGSINHTLLTCEVLKNRGVSLGGIVFNGEANPDTENAILTHTLLPCLGHLYPEKILDKQVIKKYGSLWKEQLQSL